MSLSKKIEHKFTHRFEKRIDILKLSIQDRDSVIARYVEDIKKKEALLSKAGVKYEKFKEEVIEERVISEPTVEEEADEEECGGHNHSHSHAEHSHGHSHGHQHSGEKKE